MRRDVPVSKNAYLKLVHTFFDKVHKAQSGWDVTTGPMAVKETMIGELELKLGLLTHDTTAGSN